MRGKGEMPVLTWSHNRVEQLKKLWGAGLSASQIAAELGNVSRNAVVTLQLHLPEGSESMGDHDSGSDDWWRVG